MLIYSGARRAYLPTEELRIAASEYTPLICAGSFCGAVPDEGMPIYA
jgi:hypothetical protein